MPIAPVTQLLGSRLPCSASDSAASRALWRSRALSWVPSLSEAVSSACTVPRNGCMAGLARKKVFHTASRCCCRPHGPVSWCIKARLRCAACTHGHASLTPAVGTYVHVGTQLTVRSYHTHCWAWSHKKKCCMCGAYHLLQWRQDACVQQCLDWRQVSMR